LFGLLIILLGVYFFVKRRASAKADVEVDEVQEAYADDDSEWNDFDTQVDQAAEVDESPIIAKAQALIDDGNTVKALSVLEAAVGKEPHRSDIRLKHLEVLADNNMGKQFKTHYMGLKAIGSDDDIAVANEILANTPGTDDWLAEAKDATVSPTENSLEMDHDIDDDEEVGFDGTGDLDIDDIEDLDMASISSGNGDLELDDFDAEMDEGSNAISGLDEDLDDDFSADLLATREGGEGDADLVDLDELLGSDDLNDSDEELSLDDDFSLADGDLDLDDDSAGPLEGFELDSIAAEELDEDIGLDEDFDFSLDDDDLDDFDDKAEEDDDIGTRIELAKAYVELGDEDGAKEILTEVVTQGTDEQKAEAQSLLEGL